MEKNNLRGGNMSYGWIDPDSIQMQEQSIVGDFYKAHDGKRLVLKMPVADSKKFIALIDAQSEHGIVFLNRQSPSFNTAQLVSGIVNAENRSSGEAILDDGQRLAAEFPNGTFDDNGVYKFKGTGVIDNGEVDIFVAKTVTAGPEAEHAFGIL